MFRVEDKARVKEDIQEIKSHVGTTLEMRKMAGKYVTITDIRHHDDIDEDYWYYFIKEDDGDFYWDDTLLEKVGVTLK